ncbi:hypothetical protein OIU78_007166, partial [Salix suchowensis]
MLNHIHICHVLSNEALSAKDERRFHRLPFIIHCADVEFPTQYCLTATNIFSGTRGPSSWSTILVSHLIPPTIFLTLTRTSTSSRNITAPSGRRIRSISRRMSSMSH